MDAGDLLDCRNADAPLLEIELLEGKAAWLNYAELFRVGFAMICSHFGTCFRSVIENPAKNCQTFLRFSELP